MSPAIEALQALLAAEHRAVYGYGMVGARLTGTPRTQATALWDAHRSRRDQIATLISDAGGEPASPEATYALPAARTPALLAAALEEGVLAACVPLAGVRSANLRRMAAQGMQEAMIRAVRWSRTAPADAFPGLTPAEVAPAPTP
ncbi:MAG: ferritin-like domain-containing protein [Streptosporangiaceae bacterium]